MKLTGHVTLHRKIQLNPVWTQLSEGLERCRLARLKHGMRSAAAVQQRKEEAAERKRSREEDATLCMPWSSLKKRLGFV